MAQATAKYQSGHNIFTADEAQEENGNRMFGQLSLHYLGCMTV